MGLFAIPAAIWWLAGGAAVGAGATYIVSDTVKNVSTLALIAAGVYYITKGK